jgi:K+-sensing histidine kinase KdpD
MEPRTDPSAPQSTIRWGHIEKAIIRVVVCIAVVFTVLAVLLVMHVRPDRVLSAALNIFLIVVLVASIRWGTRYAIFLSLLLTLGFSWSLPPAGHFHLGDGRVWTLLMACLVAGVTSGQLSRRARRAALDANQRRAEAVAEQRRYRDLVNSVEGIVWEADAETFVFSFVSEQAERIPATRWKDG